MNIIIKTDKKDVLSPYTIVVVKAPRQTKKEIGIKLREKTTPTLLSDLNN